MALVILMDRVASPSEITKELDSFTPSPSLGVVSYHVRRLEEIGLITLVRKAQRRGAIEHYYRAQPDAFYEQAWTEMPNMLRTLFTSAVLRDLETRKAGQPRTLKSR